MKRPRGDSPENYLDVNMRESIEVEEPSEIQSRAELASQRLFSQSSTDDKLKNLAKALNMQLDQYSSSGGRSSKTGKSQGKQGNNSSLGLSSGDIQMLKSLQMHLQP